MEDQNMAPVYDWPSQDDGKKDLQLRRWRQNERASLPSDNDNLLFQDSLPG